MESNSWPDADCEAHTQALIETHDPPGSAAPGFRPKTRVGLFITLDRSKQKSREEVLTHT
jgi:hypothetical protein